MTTIPGRPDWVGKPLYTFLVANFPAFVRDGLLDVQKIRIPLNKSHERVYQMLRKSKLTPQNATDLHALAISEENVAALAAQGKSPPTKEDFYPFVFA